MTGMVKTPQENTFNDMLPIPMTDQAMMQQKSENSGNHGGFRLKLKVDDTDYYTKKLDQHFDQFQKGSTPSQNLNTQMYFNQPQQVDQIVSNN
jgi:hypothetical protein